MTISNSARWGVALGLAAIVILVSTIEVTAQRKEKVLRNLGIGIGGAILLNEARKAQARERKRRRSAASRGQAGSTQNSRQGQDAGRIRALQVALAAQGYSVGKPDGVWGRKAREAATSFQRSLGSEPTGRLTGEEIEILSDETEGRVPPQVTAELIRAASLADEVAIGSDSPEHEIRQVQIALKDMGLYRGTVDGAWGSGTEQAVRRYQRQQGEMVTGALDAYQAQQLLGTGARLTASSTPRSTGDGLVAWPPGKRSASSSNTVETEIQRNAGGARTARVPTAKPAPSSFTTIRMPTDGIRSHSLGRVGTIFRMLIAADPTLLDSPGMLEALYTAEGRKFSSDYRKDEELSAFKSEYLEKKVPAEINIALEYEVSLQRGGYDPEARQFALYITSGQLPTRFIALPIAHFGTNSNYSSSLNIDLKSMPDVTGIPMTLDEAEALDRSLLKDKYKFAKLRISSQISNLRYDATKRKFVADAHLYSVTLEERFQKDKNKDSTIYSWSITEPEEKENKEIAAVSVLDIARDAGLRVVHGHVVLTEQFARIPKLKSERRSMAHMQARRGPLGLGDREPLRSLGSALLVGKDPSVIEDNRTILALSTELLKRNELMEAYHGRLPEAIERLDFNRMNEFDLRDTAERIRTNYQAHIVSRGVSAPFQAAFIHSVGVGTYDFERNQYPLQYRPTTDFAVGRGVTQISGSLKDVILPKSLAIDEAGARKLDARFRSGSERRLFLVAYVNVPNVKVAPDGNQKIPYKVELETTITRIALYSDEALSNLVFDYYAGDSTLQAGQKKLDEALRFDRLETVDVETVHKAIANLTDGERYLNAIASFAAERTGRRSKEESSKHKALVLERLSAKQVPDQFWVSATAQLGEFNAATSTAPLNYLKLIYRDSDIGDLPKELRSTATNLVERISLSEEDARAIGMHSSNRAIDLRLLVTPMAATWQSPSGEGAPEITYHIRKAVALARVTDSRHLPKIVWSEEYAEFKPDQKTTGDQFAQLDLGERPIFNQELAGVLALKYYDGELPDPVFRRWLASRWILDQSPNEGLGLPTQFFEKGVKLPTGAAANLLQERFTEWLRGIHLTEPTKLKVNFSPGRRFGGLDKDLKPICSELGFAPDTWDEALIHQLFDDSPANVVRKFNAETERASEQEPAILRNAILTFNAEALVDCDVHSEFTNIRKAALGERPPTSARVFVVVDQLPVPKLGFHAEFTHAEIELIVREIERRPRRDDIPDLIIYTTFENITYAEVTISRGSSPSVGKTMRVTAKDLMPEKLAHDIIGITPGMSEADADKILRKHFAEPLVFRSAVERLPTTDSFQDAVMYFDSDHKERVSIFFEEGTGDRRVLAVERVVVAPNWGVSRSDVTASAIAKYGKPVYANHESHQTVMRWGKTADKWGCDRVADGFGRIEDWKDANDANHKIYEYFEWNMARDSRFGHVPNIDSPNEDLKRCGPFLQLTHNQFSLRTVLVDISAYTEAWVKTRENARKRLETLGKDIPAASHVPL